MSEQEQKFIDLENRISHYEQTSLELNDSLINQQKRIDQLERQLFRLSSRVEEVACLPDQTPDDQPPPHY